MPSGMTDTAMGLDALGGLFGAYGAYETGRANENIGRLNADADRLSAMETLQIGEYQAGVSDIHESLLAGAQAASFVGQGVIAGAGTAANVEQASNAMSEQDKAMIRINARRQAHGYEAAAINSDFQARMAARAGRLGAASSILNAGGSIAMLGLG